MMSHRLCVIFQHGIKRYRMEYGPVTAPLAPRADALTTRLRGGGVVVVGYHGTSDWQFEVTNCVK